MWKTLRTLILYGLRKLLLSVYFFVQCLAKESSCVFLLLSYKMSLTPLAVFIHVTKSNHCMTAFSAHPLKNNYILDRSSIYNFLYIFVV